VYGQGDDDDDDDAAPGRLYHAVLRARGQPLIATAHIPQYAGVPGSFRFQGGSFFFAKYGDG
jgi:hypothetical protein